MNYSDSKVQNGLCGGAGCNANSLPTSISQMAQISSYSTIAVPAMNWVDDYFDWVSPDSPCCRVFKENGTFCDSNGNFTFFLRYKNFQKVLLEIQRFF